MVSNNIASNTAIAVCTDLAKLEPPDVPVYTIEVHVLTLPLIQCTTNYICLESFYI